MTDIPIDPTSPQATGLQPQPDTYGGGWFDPALFGPLQRFQQANAPAGSLASVPLPPPRPQGLGQGPVAGVPLPPPRPFGLGQQQPVGQFSGGYRPEGPEATSPTPSAGGPGAGSANFAQQHLNFPFLQRLANLDGGKNSNQQQGLLPKLASFLSGLGGNGSLGS